MSDTQPHGARFLSRDLMRDTLPGILVACAVTMVIASAGRVFLEGASVLALYVAGLAWSLLIAGPLLAMIAWQRKRIAELQLHSTTSGNRPFQLNSSSFSGVVADRRRKITSVASEGTLLVLNLEDLREISARYGQEWSATVIDLVAGAIRQAVRAEDIVGRLETGEFAVFLNHASEAEAKTVAERMRQLISGLYVSPQDGPIELRFRIVGVGLNPGINLQEALQTAERSLLNLSNDRTETVVFEKAEEAGMQAD